ncbi:MAG TPA: mandelate racemase/muconate lactonizing enzyme family protein, partial [Acidimicrobiales bacterium]
TFDVLLVRVGTDEGLVGWGEAFGHQIIPATKAALDDLVAPMIIGADAGDIAGIAHRLNRSLHMFGRNGPFVYALSGLDLALWDLAGKAAGMPVHRLLGGAVRAEVEAYASLLTYALAHVVADKAAAAVATGFRHVKLHERDAAAVLAARQAVGPNVELMLDPNCAWSCEEALRLVDRLLPTDLRWVEDAIWPPEDHRSMRRLRRAGLRVAAGENTGTLFDFARLLERDAVDVVQPDVTKVGGITEWRKVAALAEAHGVFLSPHSACFGPGFLATVHLLAAQPVPSVLECMYLRLEATLYPQFTEASNGRIPVPTEPGLGPDPEPVTLARYRVG